MNIEKRIEYFTSEIKSNFWLTDSTYHLNNIILDEIRLYWD